VGALAISATPRSSMRKMSCIEWDLWL